MSEEISKGWRAGNISQKGNTGSKGQCQDKNLNFGHKLEDIRPKRHEPGKKISDDKLVWRKRQLYYRIYFL